MCKVLWKLNAEKGERKRRVAGVFSGRGDNPALAPAWFIYGAGKVPGVLQMAKSESWLIDVVQTWPSIAADGDGLVRPTIPIQVKGYGAVASITAANKPMSRYACNELDSPAATVDEIGTGIHTAR